MACNLSSSKGAAYTRSYITVQRRHHRRRRCAPRPRKGKGKGQALEGMQVCEDRVYLLLLSAPRGVVAERP